MALTEEERDRLTTESYAIIAKGKAYATQDDLDTLARNACLLLDDAAEVLQMLAQGFRDGPHRRGRD